MTLDYRAIASQYAQQYGIPQDLFLRQIGAESAWDTSAVSPKGAIGLGQILPSTAKDLGIDVLDPSQNLMGAAKYLRQQYDRFGDWGKALAAYNAGPGRVAQYGGIPPFKETQNYVAKILGNQSEAAPMAPQPQPQRPQGLLEHIGLQRMGTGGPQGDIPFHQRDKFRNFAGRLAMAANTLRQRPDPNIPAAVQAGRQQRSGNRTAEWLAQQPGGEPYARMIEADPNAAASVLAAYQQSRAGASYKQVMGSDLGLTGEAAGRMFNVAPDGKITQVGGVAPTTIIGAGETEWEKGVGKAGVETLTTIQNEAAAAADMIASANYLENLMRDPAFTSGALAEPQMAYKKIVEALGGDPANVGSLEAFQAVSSQMILDKMGGSLGAGFSEGDRKFVERMAPQLSTSPEGNRMILDMQRKVAERKIQIAEFADRYIEEEGMVDEKFMGALREWSKQNPLFEVVDASSYFGQ